MNILKKAAAAVIFLGIAGGLFSFWDLTPEMAWSQSKNRCVKVMQQGKVVPNGCQLVADGKLKAEMYFVK